MLLITSRQKGEMMIVGSTPPIIKINTIKRIFNRLRRT